tara:strand:- start:556 stop:768 length:213 start_codon:yes stop_codon:yes gene_type:complete
MSWVCKIKNCSESRIRTDDKKFMFSHYTKHLRTDINNLSTELGIPNPYFENRYSLINEIIHRTIERKQDV